MKEKKSGAGQGQRKDWKFMGIMSFLDPHIQDRPTSSNMQSAGTAESLLQSMMEVIEIEKSSPAQKCNCMKINEYRGEQCIFTLAG